MADWKDITEEQLLAQLANGYHYISVACSLLPLPITLPSIEDGIALSDLVDSVAHTAQISDELPMIPERVVASLFTSCTQWLAGTHMFATFMADPKEYKLDCFAMCIVSSRESLTEAIDWLADNQE
ncbi:hypothetical protein AB0K09_15225 [Streptomyces sp. NPDC049577]|uniref:hypothetical protein n=1 Tax=Streptomyces sp. NPDC049577 TaxID=3155153 RepID=UPI003429337A